MPPSPGLSPILAKLPRYAGNGAAAADGKALVDANSRRLLVLYSRRGVKPF
jgi:hypothetical protein